VQFINKKEATEKTEKAECLENWE